MEFCGAKNRQGNPCRRPAGWGTNHGGAGRCKFHGGRSPGVKGNANAVKTGEAARPTRAEAFKRDREAAPVDPTPMLREQARTTYARLQFMYELLLQTEQELEDLAAVGDGSALGALAVVEISRKQEPRGEGATMTDVELSTKSRSLLDRWLAQHDAITRVELLYGRIAERLKPPNKVVTPGGGMGGTVIVVNAGIPGVDYDPDDGKGQSGAPAAP